EPRAAERFRPPFRKARRVASRADVLRETFPAGARIAPSQSVCPLFFVLCLLIFGFPGAMSEFRSTTESFSSSPRAVFPDNRRTSCERNRSDYCRDGAPRPDLGIFALPHNNRGVREKRAAAPDASEAIE